jgi:hypothetical protein
MPKTRVCTKCLKRKPLEKFGKNSRYLDNLQKVCKACNNIQSAISQGRLNSKPRKKYPKILPKSAICPKCQKRKPMEKFKKAHTTSKGYQGNCYDCRKKPRKLAQKTKLCKSCDYWVPRRYFPISKTHKDGHGTTCKPCLNKQKAKSKKIPKTRICTRCNKRFPMEKLVKSKMSKYGRMQCCKVCYLVKEKERFAKNPELQKRREQIRQEYRKKNSEALKEKARIKAKQKLAELKKNPKAYTRYCEKQRLSAMKRKREIDGRTPIDSSYRTRRASNFSKDGTKRVCTQCRQWFLLNKFYMTSDGDYLTYCRKCHTERSVKRNAALPDSTIVSVLRKDLGLTAEELPKDKIPIELIEARRLIVKLNRKVTKLRKGEEYVI